MSSPFFVTSSQVMQPSWRAAFPESTYVVGLPEPFDCFDTSLIFLDYMNLSSEDRERWLARCVETQRKVVVLSPIPSEAEALRVIKNGALGYGHTLEAPSRLQEMVMVVSHGGLWAGSKLIKYVLGALERSTNLSEEKRRSGDRAREKILDPLTPKERAVAEKVATGATNFEISLALDIKERTVKMHITSAFGKLKVRNRVELALLMNNVTVKRESIPNRFKLHAP